MTAVVDEVQAVPVGHQGARVEVEERPAARLNGWLGVLVLLLAGAAAAALALSDLPALAAGPAVVAVVVVA